MIRKYRSRDGLSYFTFEFVNGGSHVTVYCRQHPSFNGKSRDPHKTHLYSSGRLCFVSGREPSTQGRTEQLAKQWAEYFLEYRQTGRAQS